MVSQATTTSTIASNSVAGGETGVLGIQVSAPEAAQVAGAQVATQETLPFTGVSTSSMALLAMALAGTGVLLLMASRKSEDLGTPVRNWN